MREEEATGSAGQFRKSDFIDATEDLAGRSKDRPVETEITAMIKVSGVINKDGKTEDGVFAARLKAGARPLRMNAAKRKLMISATGTGALKEWAGTKVRLYQSYDSDIKTGGKTETRCVAMDAYSEKLGKWLDYYDYQQPKGQAHVRRMMAAESKEGAAP